MASWLCLNLLVAFHAQDYISVVVLGVEQGILQLKGGTLGKGAKDGGFHLHVVSHHGGSTHLVEENAVALLGVLAEEGVYRSMTVNHTAIAELYEWSCLGTAGAQTVSFHDSPLASNVGFCCVSCTVSIGTTAKCRKCHKGSE